MHHAAIHLQRLQRHARIPLHGLQHLPGLISRRLQRGARDVILVDVAGEPHDDAPGVGLPIGRIQPRKRGHDVDAAAIGNRTGVILDVMRKIKKAQIIPQPLHQRPGNGDRPLQRIHRGRIAKLVAQRSQQAALAGHHALARVHQHETTRAISVLGLARLETGLPHRGRLLIPQIAADGNAPPAAIDVRVGGRTNLGQHRTRNAQRRQHLLIPIQRLQIHKHGAAGVGHIGDMRAAIGPARQIPDDPRIHIPEQRIAPLGRGAHARCVVQKPLDLRARKISGQRQPCFGPKTILPALRGQIVADFIGAGVLPHDSVVIGLARVAIPHHRGLPLIGDANSGQIRRGETGLLQRARHHLLRSGPYLPRVMLHPARLRINLLMFELVHADHIAAVIENHKPSAGRALIDRADVLRHSLAP